MRRNAMSPLFPLFFFKVPHIVKQRHDSTSYFLKARVLLLRDFRTTDLRVETKIVLTELSRKGIFIFSPSFLPFLSALPHE